MNGAQSLLGTLVRSGIEVCFTNPGTSEMHFVASLDREPEMQAVLVLFEGVATAAADGYADDNKPVATLLLVICSGQGLSNLQMPKKQDHRLLTLLAIMRPTICHLKPRLHRMLRPLLHQFLIG